MKAGDILAVSGCFTKEKFIAGRTLAEIESILGYRKGRFSGGIAVVVLNELPRDFDLAAYSNVATHKQPSISGLDIAKIKSEARKSWATAGFERLVKVIPAVGHNPDLHPDVQYPPGKGAPQWISRNTLQATVVAVVAGYPNGRYIPADRTAR